MKLSSLTPEQKTRLLAELDGITCKPNEAWGVALYSPSGLSIGTAWSEEKYAWDEFCKERGRYLTSYDAIIPLVQKLDKMEQIEDLVWMLFGMHKSVKHEWVLNATPLQLCDAVLVATGKAEL